MERFSEWKRYRYRVYRVFPVRYQLFQYISNLLFRRYFDKYFQKHLNKQMDFVELIHITFDYDAIIA